MTTWIIYGVAAIVLVAAIMRLVLRRPEKRLTLPVFAKQSQKDSVQASSDTTEPDADSDPSTQETPTKDLLPDAGEAEEIQPSSSVDTPVVIAEAPANTIPHRQLVPTPARHPHARSSVISVASSKPQTNDCRLLNLRTCRSRAMIWCSGVRPRHWLRCSPSQPGERTSSGRICWRPGITRERPG